MVSQAELIFKVITLWFLVLSQFFIGDMGPFNNVLIRCCPTISIMPKRTKTRPYKEKELLNTDVRKYLKSNWSSVMQSRISVLENNYKVKLSLKEYLLFK